MITYLLTWPALVAQSLVKLIFWTILEDSCAFVRLYGASSVI